MPGKGRIAPGRGTGTADCRGRCALSGRAWLRRQRPPDRRGRQSAAIYVVKPQGGYGGYTDRWIDYRVDDHPDPVARLGELLEMHDLYFGKSPESERVTLKGKNLGRIQAILRELGYLKSAPSGVFDPATQKAFTAFIGNENFEERADPSAGWVDRPVLKYIFKKFETR